MASLLAAKAWSCPRAFGTSWGCVYRSVEWFVEWGLTHRKLFGVQAIGVDEIHWGRSKRADNFLAVIYQIDGHCRRLLWVGKRRCGGGGWCWGGGLWGLPCFSCGVPVCCSSCKCSVDRSGIGNLALLPKEMLTKALKTDFAARAAKTVATLLIANDLTRCLSTMQRRSSQLILAIALNKSLNGPIFCDLIAAELCRKPRIVS